LKPHKKILFVQKKYKKEKYQKYNEMTFCLKVYKSNEMYQ